MFVQMRRFVVTEGNAEKILDRFTRKPDQGPSLVEQQPGFIGREILVKKVRRGDDPLGIGGSMEKLGEEP